MKSAYLASAKVLKSSIEVKEVVPAPGRGQTLPWAPNELMTSGYFLSPTQVWGGVTLSISSVGLVQN